MQHKGTQAIETARLSLRRFEMGDAEPMFWNWASDPEVTRYLTWQPHANLTVTQAVLSDWVSAYADLDTYNWAIVPKELGQPIGSISVVRIREDFMSMEIGYCIGKAWWHQGITSEALRAVIAYLFAYTNVNRIVAIHDARNSNSGGVMRKCGMQYEGTLRQAGRNIQGICDICIYAILRQDFLQPAK